MKNFKLNTLFIYLFILIMSSTGFSLDYPETNIFRRSKNSSAQDNFCPRLEGTYPKNCCPYNQKEPISCFYYEPTSVIIGKNSAATSCVGGVDTTVACCQKSSRTCIKNLKEKKFIQRSIRRDYNNDKKCGFEPCPFPEYWKKDTGLGNVISRENKANELCAPIAAAEDECSTKNIPSCSELSSCPVAVTEPAPSQTPGPNTNNTTTPSPSPTPGPATGTPGGGGETGPVPPTPVPVQPSTPEPSVPVPPPEPSPVPEPAPAPPPEAVPTPGG